MTHALITAPALRARLDSGAPTLICDCSFDLADATAGARAHAQRHLPGALYLNLDTDLCGPKDAAGVASAGAASAAFASAGSVDAGTVDSGGGRGRHPLPTPQAFVDRLAGLGFGDGLHVVAYDTAGGMYAARLWWMLRWVGHGAVQVLDGGVAAWQAAGGKLQAGPVPALAPGGLSLRAPLVAALDYATLRAGLGQGRRLIVDARAPDRFAGDHETLDPVGGHIPGALNRFFRLNLGPDGCFKPPAQLQQEWQALMAGRQSTDLVMQCGSGVTACHNLLALETAGLPGAALYPGSWSEWCAQPQAPVATGA